MKLKGFLLLAAAVSAVAIIFVGCTPSEFSLTTTRNPPDGGNISPSSGTYSKGVTVRLIATAATGYRFDHWEGDASGSSSLVNIILDSNKQVTAYFVSSESVSEPTIDPATAKGILDNGQKVVCIDVRPQNEYENSHIPGAISIPFTELQDRYSKIPIGLQIIVYAQCH